MARENGRIAIPVFRCRVAPVFNWCSKIHVFAEDATDVASGQEIILRNMRAFERLRILEEEGVRTLICGALSSDLLGYGESMGLRIINDIAGEIGEVLRAYHTHHLDHPRFRLPGCGGTPNRRRARGKGSTRNTSEKANSAPSEAGKGIAGEAPSSRGKGEKGRTGDMKGAPGGFCACSRCGMAVRVHRWNEEGSV